MDDSLSSCREARCSATSFLATCLSFVGTESSRSKQSISGLRLVDFTKNLSLFPGINNKLLYMYSKNGKLKFLRRCHYLTNLLCICHHGMSFCHVGEWQNRTNQRLNLTLGSPVNYLL